MLNHKLREALHEKAWSIEVASARVGVDRVTFSRWLNGHQKPQPALLASLCKAFGKSASEPGYDYLCKEPGETERTDQGRRVPEAGQSLSMLAGEQVVTLASLLKPGEAIMFDPTRRKTL